MTKRGHMDQLLTKEFHEVESYLNKIPDIISSKIIMNDQHEIIEVHILANVGRGPKQISRDIQSTLIAKYNIQIDHKIISIAQIRSKMDVDNDDRFYIGAIGYVVVDETVEIRVLLKKGDKDIEAVVRGINSKRNIQRLVVQATLECVHEIIGLSDVFLFEDIRKVELTSQGAFLIAITYISKIGEESLLGSAMVRKDDYEAIVKATLDAVNRKMIQLSSN